MKKKSTLFLIICVILVMGVALSACSLIKTNTERQANRVLATVTVDLVKEFGDGVKVLGDDWDYVVSLDVTRRELVATVSYAINYYSSLYSQYGMSYDYDMENMLESGLKTMQTQKYNAIIAMGDLLVKAADTTRLSSMYCLTDEYQSVYGKKLVPEGVLTVAERYAAVKQVNDTFETRLSGYIGETKNDERDREKSDANDKLAEYYGQGYFVDSVSIAYKNGEEYADGLYSTQVVDDGDSDTSDIDYQKLYSKVKLTKKDAEDVFVYVPVESSALKTETDSDADTLPKYQTAKYATISFSGRIYAEVTEENDSGYEVESFTSGKEYYTLFTPRSAAPTDEEDADETEELLKTLRYTSVDAWKNTDAYTDEMKSLATKIFSADPTRMTEQELNALVKKFYDVEEGADTEKERKSVKDALRQIRSYFESSNVGYLTEAPDKKDVESYNNYQYYNGLYYYYNTQFESYILTVLKEELSAKEDLTVATEDEIKAKYETLVLKDKSNYDYLTKEEQVKKFFDTIHDTSANGLENAYYVPIDALLTTTFEVDPTDKAYKPLFTFDNDGNVTGHSALVTEENGKYKMAYAFDNGDGTYTIHMVFTTHVLLHFDNVVGLTDDYKAMTQDMKEETEMVFAKEFVKLIQTDPQLLTYLENYDKEKTYEVKDVFETDENGNPKYKTFAEATADMDAQLTEAYTESKFEDLFNAFISLTEQYNDDSGKVTKSGYVVSAGDMANNWYADFTATTLEMYFKHLVAGENPTGDGNALNTMIADAYSGYGYHKMFLCYDPLYEVRLEENGGIGLQVKINANGDTRFDTLGETVVEEKQNAAYTKWQAAQTEEKVKAHSVTNDKNYKQMVKDLKQ